MSAFRSSFEKLGLVEPALISGRVARAGGSVVECSGLPAPLGARCEIRPVGAPPVEAEVVGFRDDATILMPLDEIGGLRRGDEVAWTGRSGHVAVGSGLLGRVVSSTGEPLDGRPAPEAEGKRPLMARAPSPLERPPIVEALSTGVRVIDGLATLGRGQRIGLFAGSGVGKSVLLGMVARHTDADVVVVALVGERGREVREFIDRDLGPEGAAKAVVVVETAERSAVRRARAPLAAMSIAEHFRDRGLNVLLLIDSLTRLAHARREIGLAAGEAPALRGYPPSVFSALPVLLERGGRTERGSITVVATVLAEGDDEDGPVADAARSVLDGHLWLSRALAERGRYPAVDPLRSVSRVMEAVAGPGQRRAAAELRSLLAALRESEDLVRVGAYAAGSDARVDRALRGRERIERFLAQAPGERSGLPATAAALAELERALKS